ncbi:hypothetical protein FUAX_12230 [Fulvitalea axinellae]|uniref:Carboxymuconolactone decarboxylase-like domain-containing protein n=2 Tax=Fulvitalea axinellae TaxID=1182444 RepID=A0AAU9CIQ7_9BACT|nr:hypothetical protein FUAX_12230 [Fulvitalea axinellae]
MAHDDNLLKRLGFLYEGTIPAENLISQGKAKRFLDMIVENATDNLKVEALRVKERDFVAIAVANTLRNRLLVEAFSESSLQDGATNEELGEALVLSVQFGYHNTLGKLQGAVGAKPGVSDAAIDHIDMSDAAIGPEMVELISIAVSSVNGCKLCMKAHYDKFKKLEASEDKLREAMRVAATVVSLSRMVYDYGKI